MKADSSGTTPNTHFLEWIPTKGYIKHIKQILKVVHSYQLMFKANRVIKLVIC